ncbi:protein draper isoform X4 [Anopheles arabiensis]|uniref:protein draper isoform X4 n=1 Tax=Anopheles arabiensis TaxID=7173 RepID=UPI001AAE13ED|nr:protein draper isoform X4 [Anopheles arabiensis]
MARARKKLCMQMHPTTAVSGLLLLAMLLAICHDVRVLAHTELIKDDHLEGPNVCKEVENITVTITTPREEAYQERYQKWCLGIPPRCSAYRIKIRTVNETRTVINQRIVKKCCVGYQLDEEQLHCIPECKAGCVYGTCINPDVCRCNKGYAGKTCNISCPPNVWGSDCKQPCKCANGAVCNAADGSCECSRGFKGRYCEETCPSDRFGQDCAEICQCKNGGKCDHVSGECFCAAGYTGPLCTEPCPAGTHGAQCQSKCRCQNGGTCDPVTGVRCESRCPLGYYGESCSEICTCHNNSSCDPTTGECICSRGWTGPSCNEPCPKGFFGHGCMERCSGSAESNRTCNPITGQYSCPPGYVGPTCEHPCSSGYYGQDCQRKCPECRNGAECSHITGECQCTPGWKGPLCETVCEGMYYGTNCSQVCNCKNNAKCRKNDGTCICDAGWMGHRCDEVCPEGFYGNHCMEACECPAGNFLCHAAKGCVCSVGWTGKNCDERMTNMLTQDRVDEGSSSSTVWMVVLLLMFGAMLTAMLLYYRRRVASLKAEVNHVVNYMTQEQPSHFDNPVYARTGGGGAPNGGSIVSGTLSSNGTIVPPLDARTGLLRNVLPNNLRDVMSGRRKQNQDKYSYPDNEYDVDKSLSFSHYRPESLKNFEADMTNPNFKDHVYDEIRLKDSIAALSRDPNYAYIYTEYDHLDYSRPGSSHKAHYFRMNDGASNGNVTANGGGNLTGSIASSNAYGNGSPKAINVLRDTASAGPINNLSAPPTASRVNNLLPAIPSVPAEAKCSNTDSASLGNDLSSSSNSSSPTPPSSPSQQRQRLVPGGDDLYVPMSAGVAAATSAEHGSSASSSGSEFGGLKIPDHQLNIKE